MKIFLSVILLYTVFFFTACGDDDNSPDATTPAEKDVYAAGVLIKDGVGRATWWKNGAETIVNDGRTPAAHLLFGWTSDVYL